MKRVSLNITASLSHSSKAILTIDSMVDARYISTKTGLLKVSGIFIDQECPCLSAPLTEYAIMEYGNQTEVPADFIKRYGAYPEDRLDSIPVKVHLAAGSIIEGAHIRAFTIGEAFNYIAWTVDGSKIPTHRLLKFDENVGDFREVHSCRLTLKPKEASLEERTALQAAMRADFAKFMKGD